MSRRDTYRNYAIWIVLILFYVSFHFISNYGWIEKMDTHPDATQDINLNRSLSVDAPSVTLPPLEDERLKVQVQEPKNVGAVKASDSRSKVSRQTRKSVQINQADEADWKNLYNIGPYRAGRIIRFRNALGGFYSVDQVGETYGLPDSVFRHIKSQLMVDSSFAKIHINQIPYDSLYPHPYVTKYMAYQIVRFREKKESISSIQRLYDLLPEKDHKRLKKLEPYLEFDVE